MPKKVISVLCFMLVGVVLFSLSGCQREREKKYYTNKSNYITENAIVENVIYNEAQKHIVFWLSDIDDMYQSSDFIIKGDSVSVVLNNGILEKVPKGSIITYTSAPGYFGNGYFMPIIGLECAGETFLTVEEGYHNLLKMY